MSAAYIQVYFRLYFFIEVNTMNPDQTAPEGPMEIIFMGLKIEFELTIIN